VSQVEALRLHCEHASPGPLKDARTKRDKLKNRAKKAQKQQQRQWEAEEAAARLIPAIRGTGDIETLEEVLVEAGRWAGLLEVMDGEVVRGKDRLGQMRVEAQAARKAATLEVTCVWMDLSACLIRAVSCRSTLNSTRLCRWSTHRASHSQQHRQ